VGNRRHDLGYSLRGLRLTDRASAATNIGNAAFLASAFELNMLAGAVNDLASKLAIGGILLAVSTATMLLVTTRAERSEKAASTEVSSRSIPFLVNSLVTLLAALDHDVIDRERHVPRRKLSTNGTERLSV
jgi:hypothetical protein